MYIQFELWWRKSTSEQKPIQHNPTSEGEWNLYLGSTCSRERQKAMAVELRGMKYSAAASNVTADVNIESSRVTAFSEIIPGHTIEATFLDVPGR